jgi:Xaa-Pro aminopeptidase
MAGAFSDAHKRVHLNSAAADRPLQSPLPPEVLERARLYRKQRLVDELVRHDCAAALLYHPVNIRYALDVCAMQVWMLHHQLHYALVFADGTAIDFLYPGAEHLAAGFSTVDEVRPAIAWPYSTSMERFAAARERWADEIDSLVRQRGGANRRLLLDRLDSLGVDLLRSRGLKIVEGASIVGRARSIKSADEIALMRWTLRVAEAGMTRMAALSEPGRSEQEIWAELHHENIRSGGEWCETRLVTCGQRTNPWFQEASDYRCQEGELLSFDTDMIGPYGYCADLSRSWTIGGTRFDDSQRALYGAALEQIHHNLELVRPGRSFAEFNERSWRIPERYLERRYSVAFHGVGLSDEGPVVLPHPNYRAVPGGFEPGMTLCLESLIGEVGGKECVKLETQVLVTETGYERLDSYPWEAV